MYILSLDTASGFCSVALSKNNKIIRSQKDSSPSSQAENLFGIIQSTLKKSDISYNDLDYILVTRGPGSFTGIRIGLAAVKGISLATKAKVVGANILSLLAYYANLQNKNNKKIFVIQDARRSQIYYQIFSHTLEPISSPNVAEYEDVSNMLQQDEYLVIGDGIKYITTKHKQAVLEDCSAAELLSNASEYVIESLEPIFPIYIREADAKKNINTA